MTKTQGKNWKGYKYTCTLKYLEILRNTENGN